LGFVGRLAASKNPRFVIEVLSRLRREGAAADALFMGAGPEEEAVRALALHRGVDRQVTFLPPDAQVGDIMARRMDVLLLPSEAGFEGTPRVTIEAQACGVPVICSTGIPEDVRVVPELFHRLRVSDGCEAWAEKALELGGIRVSPDHVSACFAESPLEISNQADQLIDQYQRFLQASQTAGPGNERTP
jgi:glycosyltransferase involved in cell wall biosynthesis